MQFHKVWYWKIYRTRFNSLISSFEVEGWKALLTASSLTGLIYYRIMMLWWKGTRGTLTLLMHLISSRVQTGEAFSLNTLPQLLFNYLFMLVMLWTEVFEVEHCSKFPFRCVSLCGLTVLRYWRFLSVVKSCQRNLWGKDQGYGQSQPKV